jgi:hypothetical protein
LASSAAVAVRSRRINDANVTRAVGRVTRGENGAMGGIDAIPPIAFFARYDRRAAVFSTRSRPRCRCRSHCHYRCRSRYRCHWRYRCRSGCHCHWRCHRFHPSPNSWNWFHPNVTHYLSGRHL